MWAGSTSERKSTTKPRGNSVLTSKPEGKIKGQGMGLVSVLEDSEIGLEQEEAEEAGEGEQVEDQVPADPMEGSAVACGDLSRTCPAPSTRASSKPHVSSWASSRWTISGAEARVQLTPPGGSLGPGARGLCGGRRGDPGGSHYACSICARRGRRSSAVVACRGGRQRPGSAACGPAPATPCAWRWRAGLHVQVVFATKKSCPRCW